MTKNIAKVFALVLVALVFLTSCATTKGEDIPPQVRVVEFEEFEGMETPDDVVATIIAMLAEDETFEDEDTSINAEENTLTIKNMELASNVGFAAQDGTVVVDVVIKGEGKKATITVSYVDSYAEIYLGPITKTVHQGLTQLGMEAYNSQELLFSVCHCPDGSGSGSCCLILVG